MGGVYNLGYIIAGDPTVYNAVITVNAVNDAPTAKNVEYTMIQNQSALSVLPLSGSSDVDLDPVTLQSIDGTNIVAGAQIITLVNGNGILNKNAAGAFTFSPTAGFSGLVSIPYTVQDHTVMDPDNLTATSNLIINVYKDTDGDGTPDIDDVDDDNDGIPDSIENSNCSTSVFLENFGTGGRTSSTEVSNTYGFVPTGVEMGNNGYAIESDIQAAAFNHTCEWTTRPDHTAGDTNGRMAIFNADLAPGVFYSNPNIPVTAGETYEVSFWALNIDKENVISSGCNTNTRQLPNISVSVTDASANPLISIDTGNITRDETWHLYKYNFTVQTGTNVTFTLRNNAPGGWGNDLAIDDISVKKLCDKDGDGIPNSLDLDSDNDGILDTAEGISTISCPGVIVGDKVNGHEITAITLAGTPSAAIALSANGSDTWPFCTNGVPFNYANSGFYTSTTIPGNFSYTLTFASAMTSFNFSVVGFDLNDNVTVTANNAGSVGLLTENAGGCGGLTVSGNTLTPINPVVGNDGNGHLTFTTTLPFTSITFSGTGSAAGNAFSLRYCVDDRVTTEDTDGDGIPNYLDLDSDNDGCPDAVEGDENVISSMLVAAGGTLSGGNGTGTSTTPTSGTFNAAVLQNLGNTVNGQGVPTVVNSGGAADIGGDQGQGVGSSFNALVSSCFIDAVNDINQVPLGVTATGNVLTNDESTSNPITVQSATYLNAAGVSTALPLGTATNVYDASGVLAGSMTLNSNGTYTFVPTATYVGKVPVDYVAVNGVGSTDPAQLTIVVIKPASVNSNDNPIAQNDTGYTEINTALSSNILVNDSDPDGNALTVTGATQGGTAIPVGTSTVVSGVNAAGNAVANAGTITIAANGTYTYTPANGFLGTVNPIPYTISDGNLGTANAVINLSVLPNQGNNTFGNDDANTGTLGTTLTGIVKTNDTDPEGNPTSITAATAGGTTITIGTSTTIPGVGSLTLNSDGTYSFVPLATYVGTTSVVYTVCDTVGMPQACDTATLYLTEIPLDYIEAVNDINQVPQGVTATGNVLTNDESTTNPVTVQSATYLNSAGVVTTLPLVTATNVYDTSSGTPVLAGSMTLNSNGTYTFVPTATYVGKVPVDYVAVNGVGSTDPAQLTIVVIKPASVNSNDNPIAQNDTGYTEINTALSSNILVNDSDPDGNALTVTGATQGGTAIPVGTSTVVSGVNAAGNAVANAGTITIAANGTYTYTPANGFLGTVNPIPYTISDGNLGTANAVINLSVLPNQGNNTFGNDDANTGTLGTTLTGIVKTNDTDPEGNPTSITAATAGGTTITIGTSTTIPGVGSLTLNSDGTYSFVPLATYVGTTSVVYTVCDTVSAGITQACDTATLYLTELSLEVACYDPAYTGGTTEDTKHGITLLQRAGADNGNWPMIRKGAFTALESNSKGFVITRVATANLGLITTPQEGMMVYDTTVGCLKIYDGTKWSCFSTPACP